MIINLVGKLWKKLPKSARTFVARRMQVTFTASAAGIIVNEDGKVLLANHVLRPASGWGVPGGFLEFGEQSEAAFRREVREETGIDVHDVQLYRVRTFKRHIEVMFTAKGTATPRSAAARSRSWRGSGRTNCRRRWLSTSNL
ncbi:MAG: NUDIX domain-containing protein [Chloracidobacterium sp.]|nr:NUDIX domain-containing protein [Chloracidobacterium sp.]